MRLAHTPAQVERQPRAAAVGTFDGVHRGHQAVVEAVIRTGLAATVVTFDPHPRIVLGITVLSLYVLLFNRLLWRRLYRLAEERLRLD